MQMLSRASKKGFTLIELMLAMAFISALLVMIAMVSIQAGRIYNTGLTLRSVNQSGRTISDTIRRDFIRSDQRLVSVASGGSGSVIELKESGVVKSGRFCLGNYSYLWNSPNVLDGAAGSSGVVIDTTGKPINFVRVADEDGLLCENSGGGYITNLTSGGFDDSKITRLLKTQTDGEDVVLSIHDLSIVPVAEVADSSIGIFEVDFKVGTSRMSEIDTVNQSCRPPADSESNTEFCAINQFNMMVRTNG